MTKNGAAQPANYSTALQLFILNMSIYVDASMYTGNSLLCDHAYNKIG